MAQINEDEENKRSTELARLLSEAEKQAGVREAMEVFSQFSECARVAELYMSELTQQTVTSVSSDTTI